MPYHTATFCGGKRPQEQYASRHRDHHVNIYLLPQGRRPRGVRSLDVRHFQDGARVLQVGEPLAAEGERGGYEELDVGPGVAERDQGEVEALGPGPTLPEEGDGLGGAREKGKVEKRRAWEKGKVEKRRAWGRRQERKRRGDEEERDGFGGGGAGRPAWSTKKTGRRRGEGLGEDGIQEIRISRSTYMYHV